MSEIRKLGVLGAGQMGGGIAQAAAEKGIQVFLSDIDLKTADAGRSVVTGRLEKAVSKGKIEPEASARMLQLITAVGTMKELQEVDMVIEAASESLELKIDLFTQLDSICAPETVFATNTSSISITELAACTSRPDKFIGMHFFNPVQAMRLVEIIRGLATSTETFEQTLNMVEKLGKQAVSVEDKAGFVVNRILIPMLNEACFVLEEGIASLEDIDSAMLLGCNHPMGPLTLADYIGLDTCLAVMEVLQQQIGDDKYRPAPLLRKYVAAGWLGRKMGRGFYTYT